MDLNTGSKGWASPPGDLFSLRSRTYFTKKVKSPSGPWILQSAGVDWLRSAGKIENVLSHTDNRVMHALKKAQSRGKNMKSFVVAVNLQVPGREHHKDDREPIQNGEPDGNYSACLLGKSLNCSYHRGENYLEIEVDIGSAIATAILHLTLGYVTSVTIDMRFAIEAQCEEELPEKLFGAVRVRNCSATTLSLIHFG
ncbi:hypothetical protein POM88_013846 [Heracleum sosnowskyi]|uniref:Protein ENHANCED DISEASE RESISTANCE 2 C-terminal domain-containing protein n=1 Tax=Heracleum sosnowskyi TaxID=360622 RepID=A0AAD8IZC6_9APIA|nr:hypothetical protein POM88_013846 [Heracleum sosnowskyi]